MHRLPPLAFLGCALMMSSCATRPVSPAAPRIAMPQEARRACDLYRLPERATQADLEVGYATRGAQIVACDAARRLAVETHDAEHALEEEARHGRWP
jgi:hypothetical protein